MAELLLTQTDVVSDLSLSTECSGATYPDAAVLSGVFNYEMQKSGTAGTATYDISLDSAATSVVALTLISEPLNTGNTLWQSTGTTVVVPLEVVTADSNVSVDAVYFCRITSTGSIITTLASNTFGTSPVAGVNDYSLGIASDSDYNSSDRLMVSFVMTNAASHTSSTIQVLLSQTIQTGIAINYTLTSGYFPLEGLANFTALPADNYVFVDGFTSVNDGSSLENTTPDTIGTSWSLVSGSSTFSQVLDGVCYLPIVAGV